MKTKNYKKLIFSTLIFIVGVWLGGWLTADVKSFLNLPFGDVFNSLNALFAGLAFGGVIITIAMQLDELEETREELAKTAVANVKVAEASFIMANESKEKAILDLYQTYCSEDFQIIKTSSFNTMISAIQSKSYADFMVSRFFVVSNRRLDENIAKELPIYKKDLEVSFDEFLNKEQFDRFRLDELINFFILLSNKDSSKDVIKNCDFFYDWWRPLFWFISELQLEYYNESEQEEVRKYSKEPYLRNVVIKLDEIYGHDVFHTKKETWEYILKHPKIRTYGIDEKYNNYL